MIKIILPRYCKINKIIVLFNLFCNYYLSKYNKRNLSAFNSINQQMKYIFVNMNF